MKPQILTLSQRYSQLFAVFILVFFQKKYDSSSNPEAIIFSPFNLNCLYLNRKVYVIHAIYV